MKAIILFLIWFATTFFGMLSWLIWPETMGWKADLAIMASFAFGGLAFWLLFVSVVILFNERGTRC